MKTKLSIIKDVLGNNYLSVKVNPSIVKPFLDELSMHIDNPEYFDTLIHNQQTRDNHYYHITVMSVMEWNKCQEVYGLSMFTEKINHILSDVVVDIELLGIGEASKDYNKAYFVVVKSDDIQDVRRAFGLSDKDLHITIGFDRKDVFGVPKNVVLPKQSLLERYVKKHNISGDYSFIFDVKNLDEELIVDPSNITFVSLDETVLTVKVNNTLLQFSMMENGSNESELRLATKSNI